MAINMDEVAMYEYALWTHLGSTEPRESGHTIRSSPAVQLGLALAVLSLLQLARCAMPRCRSTPVAGSIRCRSAVCQVPCAGASPGSGSDPEITAVNSI